MREKQSGLRVTVGGVAVVAALALAGCSSGETDGPPEDTPAQVETTGAAQGETIPEGTATAPRRR